MTTHYLGREKTQKTQKEVIVEIKACKALTDEHIAQLLGYLRASGIEHGLLINFGGGRFEIRKFILSRKA